MDYFSVKGTHDIFGEEALLYDQIEMVLKGATDLYGFNYVEIPTLEYTELFTRTSGESSDVVRKEMYTFLDKGGRSVSLRPELTAGIVRCVINNKLYANQDFPLKLYSLGPAFRYERPQQGRYRQFLQFSVETIGLDSYLQDVEVISLGYRSLQMLGFDHVSLKINSLGDEISRENYKKALVDFFKGHIDHMCEDCKERLTLNPLRILDCKVKEDQEIVAKAPKMSDYLTEESKSRFRSTLSMLDMLEIPYEVDDSLVRGLDYYSHVIFEFHYTSSLLKNYGAIGAGGHYDHLVSSLGGPELVGVGYAFGIERLASVISDDKLMGNIEAKSDFYVMSVGEDTIDNAFEIAEYLRSLGYRSDVCLEKKSMGNMFKKALRRGAKYAIIIGEEEVKNSKVLIKDLLSQEQNEVSIDSLQEYVDKLFK